MRLKVSILKTASNDFLQIRYINTFLLFFRMLFVYYKKNWVKSKIGRKEVRVLKKRLERFSVKAIYKLPFRCSASVVYYRKINGWPYLLSKFKISEVCVSKNNSNNFLQTPHKNSLIDVFSDVIVAFYIKIDGSPILDFK